jgi:hypothetical protein
MGENESSKMRVVVRIRPMNSREIQNEEERVIEQIDDKVGQNNKTDFFQSKFILNSAEN